MTAPRPFIKSAGGKTRLLPEILARIPSSFNAYFEPFVGGGALFFKLRERDRVAGMATRDYFLGDRNQDLVAAYVAVRDDRQDLVRRLSGMKNERSFYEKVRAFDVNTIPDSTPGRTSAVAARFIYLNKTCFNGLHRVNRRGKFNVPFAGYAKPVICDAPNLRACSRALKNVIVVGASFEKLLDLSCEKDLVYCDPPYLPEHGSGAFHHYGAGGFGWAEHVALRDRALAAKRRGAYVVISNSETDRVLDLYSGPEWCVERVSAPRSISADGAKRQPAKELIIR